MITSLAIDKIANITKLTLFTLVNIKNMNMEIFRVYAIHTYECVGIRVDEL